MIERVSRYRGALLGLAAGDALGAFLEFRRPGTFEPITDMQAGGTHALRLGQWTDDCSMALCLCESLLTTHQFDPMDQMQRYVRWWKEGYLSSTGFCFDIGNTTRDALSHFIASPEPFCGSTLPHHAGNGSLMRLAPVPLAFAADPSDAIALSAESSRTTHGASSCLDSCRVLGAMLVGAVHGYTKQEILDPVGPVLGQWLSVESLEPKVREVVEGSYLQREPPQIVASGFVVRTLEAALWALSRSDDFRTGALMAVNLGDDSDTVGAVYGQLAGAIYGEEGIPAEWREVLAMRHMISVWAFSLHAMAWD